MLKTIRLTHFRNFERVTISFCPGINQIVGENGIGKTNLLEALCLISTGKSFRTNNLKELIQKERERFNLELSFERDGIEQYLRLSFDGKNRLMRHNATEYKGYANVLGILPSIISSPSDLKLIEGSPKSRRHFLNLHIAQSDPLYVYYLSRYTKALAHRNALLKKRKTDAIELWEQQLAKCASYLMTKRKEAIDGLATPMITQYQNLSEKKERPMLQYDPSLTTPPSPYLWEKTRKQELKWGYTIIGPHRDDFQINLKNQPAKNYASEGQKRTLISALKLSEKARLIDPFLALDDFSVHLDTSRRHLLIDQIKQSSQVFLTLPEPLDLDSHVIDLSMSNNFDWI